MSCSARRPRTADGGPSGSLRNVPPPQVGGPAQAEGPERAGKGAETTQPASRMNRPARTLTRDLVRRRHPTGASPSRRDAPGRTLSPMPSEQKGAYGGHLALLSGRHRENVPAAARMVAADGVPLGRDAPTGSPHNDRRFAVCSAVSGEAGIGLVGIADLADRWNDADRAFQNRMEAVFMEKTGSCSYSVAASRRTLLVPFRTRFSSVET